MMSFEDSLIVLSQPTHMEALGYLSKPAL